MIDAMMLSSVYMEKNKSKTDVKMDSNLSEIVVALATTNPTWSFECIPHQFRDRIGKVYVYAEGQQIGYLNREYSNRAGGNATKVGKSNDYRRNGEFTVTSDNKKAIREAKKRFTVKSIKEIIGEKYREARDIVQQQRYRKGSRAGDCVGSLRDVMHKYTFEEYREQFVSFLTKQHNSSQLLSKLKEFDEITAEFNAIDAIEEKVKTDDHVLIHINGSKYIVKTIDNVQSYDDNTLPEEYRGKLGMLKLVEVNQCVSDVGCRTHDDTFLIVT